MMVEKKHEKHWRGEKERACGVNLFKKLLPKNRTLEEELKFTAFTIVFCLFIFLPIAIIVSIILGG